MWYIGVHCETLFKSMLRFDLYWRLSEVGWDIEECSEGRCPIHEKSGSGHYLVSLRSVKMVSHSSDLVWLKSGGQTVLQVLDLANISRLRIEYI